ncbi:MAG: hypothetical protein WAS27_01725 [Candidatus Saccharimonadales bacterium]
MSETIRNKNTDTDTNTKNKLQRRVGAGLLLAAGGVGLLLGANNNPAEHVPSHSVEYTVDGFIPEGGSVVGTVNQLVNEHAIDIPASEQVELLESAKQADREYRHSTGASPSESTNVEIAAGDFDKDEKTDYRVTVN